MVNLLVVVGPSSGLWLHHLNVLCFVVAVVSATTSTITSRIQKYLTDTFFLWLFPKQKKRRDKGGNKST